MNVLVCGAGGFIGGHISQRLRAAGHVVHEACSPQMDFSRDLSAQVWLPRLEGMDAVVNAVGVLRESRARPMQAVHYLAPLALFNACAQVGIKRVLHVSALGVDGNPTLYARSKLQAEQALVTLHERGALSPTILRPSIVFGRGGASSELFIRLARLPILPLPGPALRARIQPLAVQELAEACVALLATNGPLRLDCVGPQPLTLAEFIASLRQQLRLRPARIVPLPEWLSEISARMGDHLPFQPWCRETLALLQQDNVGESRPFAGLLPAPAAFPQELLARSWQG